eukprot:755607-Hanusia_phi.AAC.3
MLREQKLEEENKELKQKLHDALMSNASIMKELLQAQESRDYLSKEWKTREELLKTEIARLNALLSKPQCKEAACQTIIPDVKHVLMKDKETQCEMRIKKDGHQIRERPSPMDLVDPPPNQQPPRPKATSCAETSTQTCDGDMRGENCPRALDPAQGGASCRGFDRGEALVEEQVIVSVDVRQDVMLSASSRGGHDKTSSDAPTVGFVAPRRIVDRIAAGSAAEYAPRRAFFDRGAAILWSSEDHERQEDAKVGRLLVLPVTTTGDLSLPHPSRQVEVGITSIRIPAAESWRRSSPWPLLPSVFLYMETASSCRWDGLDDHETAAVAGASLRGRRRRLRVMPGVPTPQGCSSSTPLRVSFAGLIPPSLDVSCPWQRMRVVRARPARVSQYPVIPRDFACPSMSWSICVNLDILELLEAELTEAFLALLLRLLMRLLTAVTAKDHPYRLPFPPLFVGAGIILPLVKIRWLMVGKEVKPFRVSATTTCKYNRNSELSVKMRTANKQGISAHSILCLSHKPAQRVFLLAALTQRQASCNEMS